MSSPIRVLIVDDEELVRSGLRLILERSGGFMIVGEAGDGREAVQRVAATRPDIVLLDIRMPGLDGIEATRQITISQAAPAVVILTTFGLDDYVFAALEAGAAAFCEKDTPPEELAAVLVRVARGEPFLSPTATAAVLRRFSHSSRPGLQPREQRSLDTLTNREAAVLAAIAQGLTNAEIGRQLHLSETTVKTHISRIFMKLGTTNRVQAAILAHRAGLAQQPHELD